MIRIEQLLEPLRKLLNDLSAEKGEVNLFGFFLREDQRVWDLAISSRWLEEVGLLEGFRFILDNMAPPLREKLFNTFRLVTVKPDDPRLAALVNEIPVENGLVELRDVELFDMDMKRAFLLQAKLPSAKTGKTGKAGKAAKPAKVVGKSAGKAAVKAPATKRAAVKAMRAGQAR